MSGPGGRRDDGASGGDAGSFALVVDAEGRVIDGAAPGVAPGDSLDPTSWLGQAALGAAAAVRAGGASEARVARDYVTGAHWIVRARAVSADPWRAEVRGTDATPAVAADRRALLASVMHSSRNVSFALLSVLDALEADRPTGAELETYLSHLREPAARLAATTAHVAALLEPRPLVWGLARVGVIAEAALERTGRRTTTLAMRPATLAEARVACDADALADAVGALLEMGIDASVGLVVEQTDVAGRAHARFVVERNASLAERAAPLAQWDLGDGHRLETRVRLAAVREVVRAHGGRPLGEATPEGRLRLGVELPLEGKTTDD